MHAGMNHCLAAAAVSRRQKSAEDRRGKSFKAVHLRVAEETGDSKVDLILIIVLNLLKRNDKNMILLHPRRTQLSTAVDSKTNMLA